MIPFTPSSHITCRRRDRMLVMLLVVPVRDALGRVRREYVFVHAPHETALRRKAEKVWHRVQEAPFAAAVGEERRAAA